MKNLIIAFSFMILLTFLGCANQKAENEKLKSENDSLKVEIEELKNGEARLVALVDKAYEDKNYIEAKKNIELLAQKHPESSKNANYKILLKDIEYKLAEIQKQKDAETKENLRLQNLNNLGIWEVTHYVDEFGDPTKKGLIRNSQLISGTFSNTATQNSDLNVRFLIDNSTSISIMLYEYAGNNPVKSSSSDGYSINIKDKDKNKTKLFASNYSDRLRLSSSDSKKLHTILLKGGEISFSIYDIERPTSEYNFIISNADFYENAFTKLTGK